jgi:hypothetical protein
MTIEERIKMYKSKKAFINKLSEAFEYSSTSVMSVDYEVYQKEIDQNNTYFAEYVIVTFVGGAISVRSANGNSDSANFKEIAKLIDGGYYDEVRFYQTLTECGFVKVNLED